MASYRISYMTLERPGTYNTVIENVENAKEAREKFRKNTHNPEFKTAEIVRVEKQVSGKKTLRDLKQDSKEHYPARERSIKSNKTKEEYEAQQLRAWDKKHGTTPKVEISGSEDEGWYLRCSKCGKLPGLITGTKRSAANQGKAHLQRHEAGKIK